MAEANEIVTLRDKVGAEVFDAIALEDPALKIMGSSPWQTAFASPVFTEDPLSESVSIDGGSKESKPEWRELQKQCWNKYRSFGPLNASVNSKSDYTAGNGFSFYSEDLEIGRFVDELFYAHRNELYARLPGWVTRMQAEVELFLLLAFDEEGRVTIRTLEPSRIAGESDDESTGLITNPDDATQTLFYMYKDEQIPDINIAYDYESLLKAAKKAKGFDAGKTKNSKAKNKSLFKEVGGYRRFVIHWKNLTGIPEYKRDTSNIAAILEAINLYWMAIKWQMDHKKAQTAYAIEFNFDNSPPGKLAWILYKNMTPAEKATAGFSGTLAPGSKISTPPGVTVEIHSPQVQKMDGENRDLLNIAGAGAQSPADMFQGDSRGATNASIKSSRPPLEMEIENLQFKLANFMKYGVLRGAFTVASKIKKFPETFKKPFLERKPSKEQYDEKIVWLDVEPAELVEVSTPIVRFETNPQEKASAFLGNNHAGLVSKDVSRERAASVLGVKDWKREKDKKHLEDRLYGVTDTDSIDPGEGSGGGGEEEGKGENKNSEEENG